ncbi:MAG: tRNA 2-thiocytidine(32) synthetase TtcA, partial [Clostridia bacterium]|nr:tRNA 2-thiocytidine(32) synthetase TtcA [Clostridia bacterium]
MLEFEGIQKMLGYTRRACADYDMIQDGDRIAIGVSGGKDSLALLCFMAKLKRFYQKKYDIVAITLDAGFPNADLSNITRLCEGLEI